MADGLRGVASAVRRLSGLGELPLGLWLAAPLAREMAAEPARVEELRRWLRAARVRPYTYNAYPAGVFHGRRVKEDVYRPGWDEAGRLAYTLDVMRIAVALAAPGDTVPISTIAGAGRKRGAGREARMAENLAAAARWAVELEAERGVRLLLCLEPEPLTTLERPADAVGFWRRAGWTQDLRRHLGICYDACHTALYAADPRSELAALDAAGIIVGKVQVSSALEIAVPGQRSAAELERLLAALDEPVYLHQVVVETRAGRFEVLRDVGDVRGAPGHRDARAWRIHFHVPIERARLAGLEIDTTQGQIRSLLCELARRGTWPLLEVETYTWAVLPGNAATPSGDLAAGIAAELRWLQAEVAAVSSTRARTDSASTSSR